MNFVSMIISFTFLFSAFAEVTLRPLTGTRESEEQAPPQKEKVLDTYTWNRCINRLQDPYIDPEGTTVPIFLTDSFAPEDIEAADTIFMQNGNVYYLSRSKLFLEKPPLRNADEGLGQNFTENEHFFEFTAGAPASSNGKVEDLLRRYEYYKNEVGRGTFYYASFVDISDRRFYRMGKNRQEIPTEPANQVLSAQAKEYLDKLTLKHSTEYLATLSDESEKTEYLKYIKESLCRCKEVPSKQIRKIVEEKGKSFQMDLEECNLFSHVEPWWSFLIDKAQARSIERKQNSERTFVANAKIIALYSTPKGFLACGRKGAWEMDAVAKSARATAQCTREQKEKRPSSVNGDRMIASLKNGRVLFNSKQTNK